MKKNVFNTIFDQTQFYFFTNVFFCQDSYNSKFKWLEFHFLVLFFFFSVLWHFDIQGGIFRGWARARQLFCFFIVFRNIDWSGGWLCILRRVWRSTGGLACVTVGCGIYAFFIHFLRVRFFYVADVRATRTHDTRTKIYLFARSRV